MPRLPGTASPAPAAALGDRSENADYIYGKKRLREIDSRLRFLQKRADELVVVHSTPDREDRVFFGAWVTVEDEDGEERCYERRRVRFAGFLSLLRPSTKQPLTCDL